jgi:hypothetical protein
MPAKRRRIKTILRNPTRLRGGFSIFTSRSTPGTQYPPSNILKEKHKNPTFLSLTIRTGSDILRKLVNPTPDPYPVNCYPNIPEQSTDILKSLSLSLETFPDQMHHYASFFSHHQINNISVNGKVAATTGAKD